MKESRITKPQSTLDYRYNIYIDKKQNRLCESKRVGPAQWKILSPLCPKGETCQTFLSAWKNLCALPPPQNVNFMQKSLCSICNQELNICQGIDSNDFHHYLHQGGWVWDRICSIELNICSHLFLYALTAPYKPNTCTTYSGRRFLLSNSLCSTDRKYICHLKWSRLVFVHLVTIIASNDLQ